MRFHQHAQAAPKWMIGDRSVSSLSWEADLGAKVTDQGLLSAKLPPEKD